MATEGMHQEAVKCTTTCNLQGKTKKKNLSRLIPGRELLGMRESWHDRRTQKKLVIQQFTTNNNSTRVESTNRGALVFSLSCEGIP